MEEKRWSTLLNAYCDAESQFRPPKELVVSPEWWMWIKLNWDTQRWGWFEPKINDAVIRMDRDEPNFRYLAEDGKPCRGVKDRLLGLPEYEDTLHTAPYGGLPRG